MIKLATVFSGIGAIEHALDRIGIEHEIVFACDNGDVDILSKKLRITTTDELNLEIDAFSQQLAAVDNVAAQYAEAQHDILNEFETVKQTAAELSHLELNDKKSKKKFTEVCAQFKMLCERVRTLQIHIKLDKIDGYTEKKRYVDALYSARESQNKVMQSYLANYSLNRDDFHWNVSFLDGKPYRNKIDLFVGGSPCQSFSLVGKQRGLSDTRGTLFYEYARLIDEIRPKVFIYENVKAVLSNDKGRTWEVMSKVFTDLDYVWTPSVLNAKDYGIPQNRERLFVVGFRKDLVLKAPFVFPSPVPLNKTMQNFLVDNVSGKYYLPKKGVDFVTAEKNIAKRYTQIDGAVQLCQKKNQQFNWHGDFIFVEENNNIEETIKDLEKYFLSEKVEKYVLSTGTKGFYSRPKTDLEIARPLLTTMHKMHRAGVDNYVTTQGRLRKLTPRECLRLMGFCDSFKIVVSDTSMYQQAGNSIVVDVLIAIMKQILSIYDFEDGKVCYEFRT